ncbi:hypothetical protein JFL43_03185 [Viridibacillus sp. YIM B01967]|uniref:Uncharacterized protein n=1 Tax=Viridibacillus soli TaxID=2798301 RepID=A0ABS1H3A6_9BACL|nr:hypothetical protein [Viridibacillus soli]MBK3493875.1 hypothetical protein [Viridibacillus soli]
MTELKELPRRVSRLALVEEIEASIQHYYEETEKSLLRKSDLLERKSVLSISSEKTDSGMAMTIIQHMIEEIDVEIVTLEKNIRHCNNNEKYYQEVLRVIKQSIKELESK